MLSDVHTPISLSIGANKSQIDTYDNPELDHSENTSYTTNDTNYCKAEFILKWNDLTKSEYNDKLENEDINDFLNVLNEIKENPTQLGIDAFMDNLGDLLIEKAKDVGAIKLKTNYKGNNGKKYHKPWFDNECKFNRDHYYRVKNKYKFINPNLREEKIKDASKKFKAIIKQKKKEYFKKLHNKIRVFKSNNVKEYWNLLNKYTKKSQNNCEIELEVLREHFKKISNTVENNTENIDLNACNSSNNEDINVLFTAEEVKKIVKKT